MCMCTYVYIHTHIPLFCLLRDPEAGDSLTAMSTLNKQLLASKYHFPLKGSKVPWRNG